MKNFIHKTLFFIAPVILPAGLSGFSRQPAGIQVERMVPDPRGELIGWRSHADEEPAQYVGHPGGAPLPSERWRTAFWCWLLVVGTPRRRRLLIDKGSRLHLDFPLPQP
jgi:hypothetical protein